MTRENSALSWICGVAVERAMWGDVRRCEGSAQARHVSSSDQTRRGWSTESVLDRQGSDHAITVECVQ